MLKLYDFSIDYITNPTLIRTGGLRFGWKLDSDRRDAGPESENPLARRRNEDALKMIVGRRPSITQVENGRIMRSRRGWKNPDSESDTEKA